MPESIQQINKIIDDYLTGFPDERINELKNFINAQTSDEQLYDRKNFSGHITASALIIHPAKRQLLLLKHKTLNRFLQPGGHVEPGDPSLVEAALREATEETGISPDELLRAPLHEFENLPFDIDSHAIQANINKDEPAHLHHDFRYLFRYTGDGTIAPDPDETEEVRWVDFSEIDICNFAQRIELFIS